MIYYRDEDLVIRSMEAADAQVFYEEYLAQGWHPDISVYEMRMKHEAEGKCVTLVAEYRGHPAGSVYVYMAPHDGPFKGKGWPEIHDFSVLKKYQRKGIGSRLMDAAERIAAKYADTVCLGVGVCDSYGSAQRIYIKRGYVPDGSGVWYQGKQCVQYETACTVDDDLIMYLSKKLPAQPSRSAYGAGNIRQAAAEDAGQVAALACELWPDHTPEEMTEEYARLLSADDAAVFLYGKDGEAAGFAQCQLRHDYVEGTQTSPVGYLEGVWVKETERMQGIARGLVAACEQWAKDQGCTEFASDCELVNTVSQAFHRAIGFEEANRLVAYVRKI
ncbi:MAG: aminoglycoside 6'-N-acetyltransferase [Eubacteriales bacterium]